MKRKIAVVLLVVMLLSLVACAATPRGTETLSIMKNGEVVHLVFYYDEQMITAGSEMFPIIIYDTNGEPVGDGASRDLYRYEYDDGDITIVYPNGAKYYENTSDTGAVISWDDHYDAVRYIEGDFLARQITKAYNTPKDWDSILLVGLMCLVMIAFCAVDVLHPEILFDLRHRWWVKNAEPTELALLMSRIGGIVGIVCFVILFLIVVFHA